jgi:hypothetical protein
VRAQRVEIVEMTDQRRVRLVQPGKFGAGTARETDQFIHGGLVKVGTLLAKSFTTRQARRSARCVWEQVGDRQTMPQGDQL